MSLLQLHSIQVLIFTAALKKFMKKLWKNYDFFYEMQKMKTYPTVNEFIATALNPGAHFYGCTEAPCHIF